MAKRAASSIKVNLTPRSAAVLVDLIVLRLEALAGIGSGCVGETDGRRDLEQALAALREVVVA
jgi:hypothetical protein